MNLIKLLMCDISGENNYPLLINTNNICAITTARNASGSFYGSRVHTIDGKEYIVKEKQEEILKLNHQPHEL